MTHKVPNWFQSDYDEAVEIIETDTRIYAIGEQGGMFRLSGCDKDGLGGMGTPWMNRQQFERALAIRKLFRQVEQLTLGL